MARRVGTMNIECQLHCQKCSGDYLDMSERSSEKCNKTKNMQMGRSIDLVLFFVLNIEIFSNNDKSAVNGGV